MPPEPQLRETLLVFLQTEAFPCNWAKKVGSLDADCDRAQGGRWLRNPALRWRLVSAKAFPWLQTEALSLSCSSSFSFLVMELEASHLLSAGLHPVLSQALWLKDFGRAAAASFLNIPSSPARQGGGAQAWFAFRCLQPWRDVLKQHAGVSTSSQDRPRSPSHHKALRHRLALQQRRYHRIASLQKASSRHTPEEAPPHFGTGGSSEWQLLLVL